ncbi:MAG TPA: hypothetical protein VMY39_07330, partial [Planctomycetota bacterium]|nr:hypothetical protein [Planctomycetota bacterium]
DFDVAGVPMGGEGKASGPVAANVRVVGSHAVDRIELIHNNVVAATYCHAGTWERRTDAKRWKFRFVAGWGPCSRYGFRMKDTWSWDCRMELAGGQLRGVEKCVTLPGQKVSTVEPHRCTWHLETWPRDPEAAYGSFQGLVFEIAGGSETRLHIQAEGQTLGISLGELAKNPVLCPLIEETRKRGRDDKKVDPAVVENPDIYFANARKIKLHRAVPEAAWKVDHTFGDLVLEPGPNWFYVRVTQTNGQLAWSSPVWIDAPATGPKA